MSEGETRQKNYPLWSVPVWRMGASFAFPLYKALRDRLGWRPGDMLLCRCHPPYVTFRVAHPERIIPIGDFGPEVLPPSWPGKDDNATTPNDSTPTDTPAARAGEGVDTD